MKKLIPGHDEASIHEIPVYTECTGGHPSIFLHVTTRQVAPAVSIQKSGITDVIRQRKGNTMRCCNSRMLNMPLCLAD